MKLRNLFSDIRPIYGQDPFITNVDDSYVLCESVDEERITLSKVKSLNEPRRLETMVVWDDPGERQVWAPELHYIEPYWFIYYAASDGCNETHRTKVLCAGEPFGPYHLVSVVGPDFWGIDMTTFMWHNKRYTVWSGWEDNNDQFPQNLYIGEMSSPWQVNKRVKLSVPELDWELSVCPILEGPQVWIDGSSLHILYSANASWKQEYSTGKLTLVDRNILDPKDWGKRPRPLMRNAGHGCVVDDHFVYHRKLSTFPGWTDREIRVTSLKELGWIRTK